jgi:uncharacterized protein YkwD
MEQRASSISGKIEALRRPVELVPPDPSWPATNSSFAAEVVRLVNEHRTGMGLTALGSSGALQAAADWKSRHMAAFAYMAHDDPAPPIARTWDARIRDNGYTGGFAGENIAMGYPTADSVVQGWLNSPGHRANIENGTYNASGVSAAMNTNGWFWTQDFGVGSDSPPPSPSASEIELVFRNEFLPELRNSKLYQQWQRSNPGEAGRFDSFLAGNIAQTMVTPFGRALMAVVKMRRLGQ